LSHPTDIPTRRKRDDPTLSHTWHELALRSPLRCRLRSGRALVGKCAETLLSYLLHILLLLRLTLLQDALRLLHHLLLCHIKKLSFTLLRNRPRLLLHLHLHIARRSFLLGL
jgi:hypothetical protein